MVKLLEMLAVNAVAGTVLGVVGAGLWYAAVCAILAFAPPVLWVQAILAAGGAVALAAVALAFAIARWATRFERLRRIDAVP